MKHVLFVAYPSRDDARELATSAIRETEKRGVPSDLYLVGESVLPPISSSTLVVSLGGDGTFLHAARLAHAHGSVVLGVNLGRVGFLLSVAPGDLLSIAEGGNARTDWGEAEPSCLHLITVVGTGRDDRRMAPGDERLDDGECRTGCGGHRAQDVAQRPPAHHQNIAGLIRPLRPNGRAGRYGTPRHLRASAAPRRCHPSNPRRRARSSGRGQRRSRRRAT